MMSREERRLLAAIEQQMLIDDPAFARLFTGSLQASGLAWRRAVAAVVATLCALATLAGLLAGSLPLVLSAASMGMAAGWVFRRARRPTR